MGIRKIGDGFFAPRNLYWHPRLEWQRRTNAVRRHVLGGGGAIAARIVYQDNTSVDWPGESCPLVSVIVPNYNHVRFLPKRIDSILRQAYQDVELILPDDCSTDGSRKFLSQYGGNPRVRLEFNHVNSGSTYKQWNRGVSLAQGEYV